jgi:hypothetical protein
MTKKDVFFRSVFGLWPGCGGICLRLFFISGGEEEPPLRLRLPPASSLSLTTNRRRERIDIAQIDQFLLSFTWMSTLQLCQATSY